MTQPELAKLLNNMGNVAALGGSGVVLGGIKYMYLSGDDTVVRAKKGTSGVHASKSNVTLLVGIYDDPLQPGEAAQAVEEMTEYLKGQGC